MSRSQPIEILISAPQVSEEESAFLAELAKEMVQMLEGVERGLTAKYDTLDSEEGLSLWGLLPAKVKTAIKRGRETPRLVCPECGLMDAHMRHCSIGGRFA